MAAQINDLTNSPNQSPTTSATLKTKCPINESHHEDAAQSSKAIKLHVDASPSQQADSMEVEVPIKEQIGKQPENADDVQLETAVGGVVGGKSSAFAPFSKLNELHQIPSMNLLRGQQMRSGMVNDNALSAGSSKSSPMVLPMDSSSDKSPQVDEGEALSVVDTPKSTTNDSNVDTFLTAAPRAHAVLRAVNVIRRGTVFGGSGVVSTVAVARETTEIVVEQYEEAPMEKTPEYLVLFPLEAPFFPVNPEELGLRSKIEQQERRRHPSLAGRRFKSFSRLNFREAINLDGDEVDLELRLG